MAFRRALRAAAATAALALVAAGCGGNDENTLVGSAEDGKLTVGIRYDQPGMGQRRVDGKVVGFDVDVAKYVAKELGVQENGITWKESRSADREKFLENGEVDFVVASYSITDKRKEQVTFAGPYFETGQGLLVRFIESSIAGPEDLDGKRLCSVSGSTSAQKILDDFQQNVRLVEYGQYSDCVTALLAGNVDAVTTDQVILAGYVQENPELLKLVGDPFTTERYGVGLPKGDDEGRAKAAAAIQKMISTGAWQQALLDNIGESDYKIPDPPQITEQ
ncbi:glutamate ABC transporter substrate-binding protein [Umezawaea beigongshangensis]|uniref:glutamate ABC transporter substrate-binding protein n=1 Tax=Umezawaea beigongshangensis TaxID=2780383 RepID=UPI0018F12B5D|nr:glutamate ABC transporter substrate-binding protein [Umezawaea beigongshangensis]